MSYQPKIRFKDGGDTLEVASGGKIQPTGGQAAHIADFATTTDLTGVDTGTDMTAAQAAQIEADFAALQTKLNAVLVVLENAGLTATS